MNPTLAKSQLQRCLRVQHIRRHHSKSILVCSLAVGNQEEDNQDGPTKCCLESTCGFQAGLPTFAPQP